MSPFPPERREIYSPLLNPKPVPCVYQLTEVTLADKTEADFQHNEVINEPQLWDTHDLHDAIHVHKLNVHEILIEKRPIVSI